MTCTRGHLLALAALIAVAFAAAPADALFTRSFDVAAPGEAVASIVAACARCSWGESGREAAALRLLVDGRYSQHLLLARGADEAEYRVTLGALGAGHHELTIEIDPVLSARGIGATKVSSATVTVVDRAKEEYLAQSMAPILHARENTVGGFTDLPILMWYEIVPTPRGRQFRYSVVFTNEDGGTATDRLMATWGRTTDIEYVYGVELDGNGGVLTEEYQGPRHEVPPFAGRRENRHPLLWVATDNNMVSPTGTSTIRYAPAPERFDLTGVSREVVMDAHTWSYQVAAQELKREGKIAGGNIEDARPGSGKIPDLRRFVFVEACADLANAAVAFSIRADKRWHDSDRGLPEFRIVRTGCFRGAVPLPASAGKPDAIRFRAFSRPPESGAAAAAPATVRVTRVNKVFTLDAEDRPHASIFRWLGALPLAADGEWREVVF